MLCRQNSGKSHLHLLPSNVRPPTLWSEATVVSPDCTPTGLPSLSSVQHQAYCMGGPPETVERRMGPMPTFSAFAANNRFHKNRATPLLLLLRIMEPSQKNPQRYLNQTVVKGKCSTKKRKVCSYPLPYLVSPGADPLLSFLYPVNVGSGDVDDLDVVDVALEGDCETVLLFP